MTGWRCGWACGNRDIVAALAKVKGFLDTGQFMAVQRAGVAAIESWKSWVPGNIAVFKERRDAAVKAFRENGFTCESPKGTMYLWLPLPDGIASAEFAERLLGRSGSDRVCPAPDSGRAAKDSFGFPLSLRRSGSRRRQYVRGRCLDRSRRLRERRADSHFAFSTRSTSASSALISTGRFARAGGGSIS